MSKSDNEFKAVKSYTRSGRIFPSQPFTSNLSQSRKDVKPKKYNFLQKLYLREVSLYLKHTSIVKINLQNQPSSTPPRGLVG